MNETMEEQLRTQIIELNAIINRLDRHISMLWFEIDKLRAQIASMEVEGE